MTDLSSILLLARRLEEIARRGEVDPASAWAHLWTWDHLYAIPATRTSRSSGRRSRPGPRRADPAWPRTFRNPGLVAKTAATLDHISGGRAILGIGGAWMELEHQAHGIDFGSGFGQRLDWLDESVAAMRGVLDGRSVTSAPGGHYRFDDLRHQPLRSAAPPDHDRRQRREEALRTVALDNRHVERDGAGGQ
jgi:hypothetical protein